MAQAEAIAPAVKRHTLYEARRKIHTLEVKGTFRTIKWRLLFITLGVYYLLPFLRWHRGPHEPTQAVLVDLTNGRFYFFFIELWPQEVYYVTGLLILAAFTLFLMNAVAGRVWCGYICPQTVWTDLFMAVERLIEGDRRARIRLDAMPWNLEKFALKLLKHSVWVLIAWWTGGAWVLYFADAPTLVMELATFAAPPVAYMAIAILTFTTYTLAGHMREQVCTYMCPWPRIQGALTDEHSLNITYRYDRGEPRGSAKKNVVLRTRDCPPATASTAANALPPARQASTSATASIWPASSADCAPTPATRVMAKVGRPLGLIAYDTDENLSGGCSAKPPVYRIVRPRTLLYSALIVLTGAVHAVRAGDCGASPALSILHDRNPIYVTLSDGSIRNGYTAPDPEQAPDRAPLRDRRRGLPGARDWRSPARGEAAANVRS